MNHEALLALISNLYAGVLEAAAKDQRIAQLEAALAAMAKANPDGTGPDAPA